MATLVPSRDGAHRPTEDCPYAGRMDQPDDRRVLREVLDALRTALELSRDVGATGIDLVGSGVDDAVRLLVDQRVRKAMQSAPDVPDAVALADALRPRSSTASVAGRVGQVSRRLSGRFRAASFVARRSPTGFALRWGPMVVDAVRDSIRSIDAVAEHLVARTRRVGIDPDPERVRTTVVQALTGQPLDPAADPDHTQLARRWLRHAGGQIVPFGLMPGRAAKASSDDVLDALARLDVGLLQRG